METETERLRATKDDVLDICCSLNYPQNTAASTTDFAGSDTQAELALRSSTPCGTDGAHLATDGHSQRAQGGLVLMPGVCLTDDREDGPCSHHTWPLWHGGHIQPKYH